MNSAALGDFDADGRADLVCLTPTALYVFGGRVQKLRPMHISNVALVDPETGKATRVNRERTDKGVVRVSKKSGHRFE